MQCSHFCFGNARKSAHLKKTCKKNNGFTVSYQLAWYLLVNKNFTVFTRGVSA